MHSDTVLIFFVLHLYIEINEIVSALNSIYLLNNTIELSIIKIIMG